MFTIKLSKIKNEKTNLISSQKNNNNKKKLKMKLKLNYTT